MSPFFRNRRHSDQAADRHGKPADTNPADTSAAVTAPAARAGSDRRWASSRGRLWLFRLAAVLVIPALLLAALEMVCRMAGAGYPVSFVVQSESKPDQWVDNYKFAWRFFPPPLARASQALSTPQAKPPQLVRIVVLGGSAAMGDPEPAYGMPRMLQALLELRFPDRTFEVINAAVTAINSHVVLQIARDCRRLQPDAWILYVGNNEVAGPFGAGTVFGGNQTQLWLVRSGLALKRTRSGQLLTQLVARPSSSAPASWGGMEMFLDHQVRSDDPQLERVYRNYRANLVDILKLGQSNRTPVVIGTVVTNLRDSPPFASLPALNRSPQASARWKEHFEAGCVAQSRGELTQALELFLAAQQIDDQYAELHFRLGQSYLHRARSARSGDAAHRQPTTAHSHANESSRADDHARRDQRSAELADLRQALQHFVKARDLDTLRFRADTRINQTIRDVARQHSGSGVFFVDCQQQFAARTADGIVGSELLWEHVHLRVEGNYLLAKLMADQLLVALRLPTEAADDVGAGADGWPTLDACAERLGLTAFHRLLLAREMKSRFAAAPFNRQLGHEQRDAQLQQEISRLTRALDAAALQRAIQLFERQLRRHPHDWILRKQFSQLLESSGNLAGSVDQWQQIVAQLPHHAESHYTLGTLLNQQQQWEQAAQRLTTALSLRPDYARAHHSLGIAYSHLDQISKAHEHFAKAVQLQPTYAEAFMNWGLVLANQNDEQGALKKYRSAIDADANYLPAHLKLGQYYVAQKQFEAAEEHYLAVVRMKPDDVAGLVNLGLLYLKLNRPAEAKSPLERALGLDPDNTLARRALQAARDE